MGARCECPCSPAWSIDPGMHASSLSGNREVCGLAAARRSALGRPKRSKPMTNDPQKSDLSIQAMKSANKPEGSGAESMERRGGTEGNTQETHTRRAQDRVSVTTGLDRVRKRAKERKEEKFTTLLHHVDTDLLRRAYFQLKRKAAPGVDQVTWQEYGEQLEANLAGLQERVHRGAYRAPPSRRVYIEKEDGRKRPLGIASLEDKILQRAVVEVLNAIYEVDFLGFSYGIRPGRSQHDALDALAYAITTQEVNFILDLDVERFFDKINHGWLIEFLKHRIADRRVLRLIGKWLKAGVMEDAVLLATEEGTPQGGSATPRTLKVISNLSAWWQVGGGAPCLICVSRSNMFMTDGPIDQGRQGPTAERRSPTSRARHGVVRSCAKPRARVQSVAAASISVPRGGRTSRSAGRDRRGNRSHNPEAPAGHCAPAARLCEEQRSDYRNDRDPRAGRLSRRPQKAWLSGAYGVAHFK